MAGAYDYRGGVVDTLADSDGEEADSSQAIDMLESLRDQLGEKFSASMIARLALAYANRGGVLDGLGDPDGAREHYGRATDLLESLRKQLGEKFPPSLSELLEALLS